jgi:hypothetical protein
MSVEKKIAELLAESKKLQDMQNQSEQIDEQSEELDEAAADTIKTKGGAQGGGDNPDNKAAVGGAITNKPEVSTKKDTSKSSQSGAGQSSELDGKDAPKGKAPVTKAFHMEDVNVDDDVAALVEGEELSEEFKAKAATIFEAAVVTRVKAEIAKIQEQYDAQLVEEFAQIKEELVEKVDGYLGYITEQWMKQNELALESGIKAELAESFIDGIKRVFEEHYVDVPAEKYDVLGSLEEQVTELQSKLNETVESNIEMSKQIAVMQKEGIITELSDGLTVTESEKFHTLASEIVCEDVDSYTKKLQTIRESYFKSAPATAGKSVVVESDEPAGSEEMINESVAHYAQAIAKFKK